MGEVEDQFAAASLRRVELDVVQIPVTEDFRAYAARLHLKASSIFEHMAEREIEEGFARLDADVARGEEPAFRLAEDGDLLVLESPA